MTQQDILKLLCLGITAAVLAMVGAHYGMDLMWVLTLLEAAGILTA